MGTFVMVDSYIQYDLYLDESGDFTEAPTSPSPQPQLKANSKKFPSQIAGLLVPREDIKADAENILQAFKSAAHLPATKTIHATEIFGYDYYLLVETVLRGIQEHPKWQAVRLVNEEKVPYGGKIPNYTNIVAELVLRIAQKQSKLNQHARVKIRLVCARYMFERQAGVKSAIKEEEYLKRIHEYLGFAAVRRGIPKERLNWEVDELILDSARIRPELQICDVLSNASHGKGNTFTKLKGQPKLVRMLTESFGEYNQTMVVEDFLDRVDVLIKEYSYGLALITLVEHLIDSEGGSNDNIELRNRAKQRLDKILDCLVRVGVRGRDPQLAVLVSWLDQIIGQQRLPEKGYELAIWLQKYIALPLRQKFTNNVPEASSTLDWFEYSLHRWALTAANHRGALIKATTEVQAMKKLEPSLARQWERAPLLMEGFIVQAVHQMDCFDFENASAQMKLIAESLKSHSKLLNEHLIKNLPNQIHFDLRAKALGTLVQSETLACLTEANFSRLNQTRAYSDEAIAEFSNAYDRVRQYQYRCQLETVVGNFNEARQYLSRSLSLNELPDLAHTQIADAIENLADTRWIQGFALLHWLRLGAAIGLYGKESDRQDVWHALDNSHLLDSYWCEGKNLEYPVHSILRYVALIQAIRGNWDQALTALNNLREIDPISSEYLVLGTILLAAQTEIAALLWEKDQKLAQNLIDNDNPNMYGAKQLLLQIQEKSENQLHGLSTALDIWLQKISELLADKEISTERVKDTLLELSRMIGY
jgi:hypothetical protein